MCVWGGGGNRRQHGVGRYAIRIQGLQIQYADNGKLTTQGKKGEREALMVHLPDFANREQVWKERRQGEEANDPERRHTKKEMGGTVETQQKQELLKKTRRPAQ